MLDAGLTALNGGTATALSLFFGNAKGDGMAELMSRLIFGRLLRERIGRRRKFVFTLLRSCCRAARSFVMSSGRDISSSAGLIFRSEPERCPGDESEESESDNCNVSTSSSSDSVRSVSLCTWIFGAAASRTRARSMSGGRIRFENMEEGKKLVVFASSHKQSVLSHKFIIRALMPLLRQS